jgi:hypothetical protein
MTVFGAKSWISKKAIFEKGQDRFWQIQHAFLMLKPVSKWAPDFFIVGYSIHRRWERSKEMFIRTREREKDRKRERERANGVVWAGKS